MARKGKTSMVRLSPGQASYVLERIIADRRVSARDVSRYVSEMQQEIGELERRLEALRQASGRAAAAASPARKSARPARGRKGAKKRAGRALSPEQRASQKLQGRYLGLIRQFPASRRGQYQKVARERGREAAIKEMANALGK